VSDPINIWYHVRRKKQFFPCRSGGAPGQLHREQIAPNDTASGHRRKVTAADLNDLQPTGTLSTNANESTHSTHQIMKMLLISWGIAGLFGVAFVQTALQSPLQQNSGTQQFVRVVR